MKTDEEFGKLFQENPSMLTDLMGVETKFTYSVTSETFKDVNRSADLCWQSPKSLEVRIIEIQGYWDRFVFHRGEIERTLFSMRHPEKKVVLVVIFLSRAFHPHGEPWETNLKTGHPNYLALYLEDLLTALAGKRPEHPLLSALAPITITDEAQLRLQANHHHRTLGKADLSQKSKRSLLEVFESLLMTRFRAQNKKELYQMLASIGDITESVAYQEIFAEGKVEGELKGEIKGQILLLDKLLTDGLINRDYYEKTVGPLKQQLRMIDDGPAQK